MSLERWVNAQDSRGSLREPTLLIDIGGCGVQNLTASGWVAESDQREGSETEGTLKLSGPSASLLTLPPRRINSQPICEPTLLRPFPQFIDLEKSKDHESHVIRGPVVRFELSQNANYSRRGASGRVSG